MWELFNLYGIAFLFRATRELHRQNMRLIDELELAHAEIQSLKIRQESHAFESRPIAPLDDVVPPDDPLSKRNWRASIHDKMRHAREVLERKGIRVN